VDPDLPEKVDSDSDDDKVLKDAEDSDAMETEEEEENDDSDDQQTDNEEDEGEDEDEERTGRGNEWDVDGENIRGRIWSHYFNIALRGFDSEAMWSKEFIDHVGMSIRNEMIICDWLRRTKFYHNIKKTVEMYQRNGVNVKDANRKAWQANRNLIQSYMKEYIQDVSNMPA
jgi:cobalamin biosynthesis protein CobT